MEPLLYGELETPLGPVFVAAGERGLRRVSYGRSEAAFLAALAAEFGVPAARDEAALAGALAQLEEYFAGRRRAFDLPLDLRDRTPFQRRVMAAVAAIPFGRVESYGEVAERVGAPRGARAVGGVMRQNPLPLIVPCHRVVRGDRSLGGFFGGLEYKARLLALEGLRVAGEPGPGARVHPFGPAGNADGHGWARTP